MLLFKIITMMEVIMHVVCGRYYSKFSAHLTLLYLPSCPVIWLLVPLPKMKEDIKTQGR